MRRRGGFLKGEEYMNDNADKEMASAIVWGALLFDPKMYRIKKPKEGDPDFFVTMRVKHHGKVSVMVEIHKDVPLMEMALRLRRYDKVMVIGERIKKFYYIDGNPVDNTYMTAYMIIPQKVVNAMELFMQSPHFDELTADKFYSAGDYEDAGLQNRKSV